MKYLKTYESTICHYPNKTDKQYWIFSYEENNIVLKFIKYEPDNYNGEYFFDAIALTPFDDFKIGDKIDNFSLYDGGLKHFQKEGKLRLATPKEIEKYKIYNNANKYNI